MKTFRFLILASLCAVAQGAWAQTSVSTDSELRSAITDGANITVTADIDLSNSTLNIASGTTVTIDLGGHTLDRKLTKRGEGGGQVITVRSGATLNLSNGTLTGGWGGAGGALVNEGGTVTLTNVTCSNNVADDRGGGICNREGGTLTMTGGVITDNSSNDNSGAKGGGGFFNEEDATATLTGVTITGNKAKVCGGGGICNFGTLTIDGCTITGNTAGTQGGGIWQEGTLNMQGMVTISDNMDASGMADNVYLKSGKVITVTGSLAGSNVGLNMESGTGAFTSGYNTHNSSIDPATVFTPDLSEVMAVSLDGIEAKLASSLPEGTVYYIERSWDEENKCVKAEVKTLASGSYTVLQSSDDPVTIQPGYYVVKGDIECERVYCAGGGKHHLILCDGAKLSTCFVRVEDDNELYIYGQTNDSGKLFVDYEGFLYYHAGIGGDKDATVGTIVIHGGDINSNGSEGAAGIGCGRDGNDATIVIYGGNIYALGHDIMETDTYDIDQSAGAGIGGGDMKNGSITIYGGHIEAQAGGLWGAAGIGSGHGKRNVFSGGVITIYGGDIFAKGGKGGSGIGGGEDCNAAYVTIHGGVVRAWGRANGPGIGCGCIQHDVPRFTGELTVTGGEVYAYGSEDDTDESRPGGGAGIGGGRDVDGSKVTISGGYVYAQGGKYAAGIGSGCEALFSGGKQGGTLTVTGGRVEAYGGVDAAGIGGGEDADGGTVNISGGYVYAEGNDGGAGIGGGEEGDGGKVTITGGTVIAKAGREASCSAIGSGYDGDENGSLTLGDDRCVYITSGLWRCKKENRVSDCWAAAYLQISECHHGGATFSIVDGEKHAVTGCNYCYAGEEAHSFGSYGECEACRLIGLADDADNSETISHWATENGVHAVTLSGRVLYKDGAWNTLTLPFAVDDFTDTPLEGATVKTLTSSSFDDGTLTLNFSNDNLTSIEAGKPYIVKWGSGDDITNPVFENVTISNATSEVETEYTDFKGTCSPMAIADEDKSILFLGAANTLYYPNDAMTINACRAYFTLKGITAGELDANNVKMYFGEVDDADGIGEVKNERVKSEKYDNAVYDLSGRKINSQFSILNSKLMKKGVYICNGRKVLY